VPVTRRVTRRKTLSSLYSDNVVRESAEPQKLKCGHSTKAHPLAVIGERRLWLCPEGCDGLQERAHQRAR